MILIGIEGTKRAIPLPVKQTNAVPVEYIHHVRIVARCRRHRRRWTDLRTSKELHFWILISLTRIFSLKHEKSQPPVADHTLRSVRSMESIDRGIFALGVIQGGEARQSQMGPN